MAKLHLSKAWMHRQYVVLKRTPATIAKEAGVSPATVYRKLKEFGLIR